MAEVQRMQAFDDGVSQWIGAADSGRMRKVSRLIGPEENGANNFRAGITIFNPGENSSRHVHAEHEEVNVVLGGRGEFDGTSVTLTIEQGDVLFIPPGVEHQHRTTGSESLILFWLYSPVGELPDS